MKSVLRSARAFDSQTATVIPVASKIATPATAVVFIFVQAMIFNAPLMMIKVEPLAVTPFVIATAVIDFANASGAAFTEWPEIVSAMLAVVEITPRLE